MTSKIQQNKTWSRKLQWTPDTFGYPDYNDDLIDYFMEKQKEFSINTDGVFGLQSFTKWLEYNRSWWDRHIIYSGVPYPLEIDVIDDVVVKNPWHFITEYKYEDLDDKVWTFRRKGFIGRPVEPHGIVIHNALCYDNDRAMKVFFKTGYAPHFAVDNFGRSIYQLTDPCRYKMYHVKAQNGKFNTSCIGIDNVNLLEKKWLGNHRNTHESVGEFLLHKNRKNRSREFLRLHTQQVIVCHSLVDALCQLMGISHKYPDIKTRNDLLVLGDRPDILSEDEGVWAHGMIQKNRWDGLDYFVGLYEEGLI